MLVIGAHGVDALEALAGADGAELDLGTLLPGFIGIRQIKQRTDPFGADVPKAEELLMLAQQIGHVGFGAKACVKDQQRPGKSQSVELLDGVFNRNAVRNVARLEGKADRPHVLL